MYVCNEYWKYVLYAWKYVRYSGGISLPEDHKCQGSNTDEASIL